MKVAFFVCGNKLWLVCEGLVCLQQWLCFLGRRSFTMVNDDEQRSNTGCVTFVWIMMNGDESQTDYIPSPGITSSHFAVAFRLLLLKYFRTTWRLVLRPPIAWLNETMYGSCQETANSYTKHCSFILISTVIVTKAWIRKTGSPRASCVVASNQTLSLPEVQPSSTHALCSTRLLT